MKGLPPLPAGSDDAAALRVAYVVNHYPKVSHSFIRREIQALEQLGIVVQRIAVRGRDDALVDPRDREERGVTQYVLGAGPWPLMAALCNRIARHPRRLLSAFALATFMGRRADKSVAHHWMYVLEACLIAQWIERSGARHLHAHFGTNSTSVAMFAAMLTELPYSFTAHGPEEFERARGIALSEKIRRAAFVVAISSFGRSQLYRWVEHAHWSKVAVVHCGLDPAFHAGATQAVVTAPRFVCVGRLCEEKGQMLLIEALRVVRDRGVDAELVFAGDGELRTALDERVHALGLASCVRVTGWISSDQVRAEIEQARAMVLPSFAEGLPVVIMEAMALRRPVISTYVAGIPELVVDGQTGWLIPAGDIDRIADAMQACMRSTDAELEMMGEAARRRALARHDVNVEAARLARLLQDSVTNASAPVAC